MSNRIDDITRQSTLENNATDSVSVRLRAEYTDVISQKDKEIQELKGLLARKEKELSKNQELRKCLQDVSLLAARGGDINELYRELHRIVFSLIEASHFYIAIVDHERTGFSIDYVSVCQNNSDYENAINRNVECLSAYLYQIGTACLLEKTQLRALYQVSEGESEPLLAESLIGFPLIWDGVLFGVVVIESYDKNQIYQPWQREFIDLISNDVTHFVHRYLVNKNLLNFDLTSCDLANRQLVSISSRGVDDANKASGNQEEASESSIETEKKVKFDKLQVALYEIANIAFDTEDISQFYCVVHRILSELMYAENFYIALLSEDKKSLVFKYFRDQKDGRFAENTQYPLKNKSLSCYLYELGSSLLLDKQRYNLLHKEKGVKLVGAPFESWLGVPLIDSGETIGVIVIQSYSKKQIYDSWHRTLLEYVSNHIAIALHRVQTKANLEAQVLVRTKELNREIEKSKKGQAKQSALYLIANLASYDLPLSSFYKEIHVIISSLVYGENFYIALKDEETGNINMAYYVDTVDVKAACDFSNVLTNRLKSSITGYVIEQGRSLLLCGDQLAQLAKDENLDIIGPDTTCWLGVPLIIDERIIGVMTLQSYLSDCIFTEKDRELMIFVGQHVAAALQRKRNKDYLEVLVKERTEALNTANEQLKQQIFETEQSRKRQSALFKITDLSITSRDINDLYHAIHRVISELMFAEHFYIATVDLENQRFVFQYVVDAIDVGMPKKLEFGRSLTSYVYNKAEIVHLTSKKILELERLGEVAPKGPCACEWVGVPLKLDGVIFGIMVLQSYDGINVYDEEKIEILNFVSSHIAEVLHRQQADERLREAYADLAIKTKKSEEASEAKSSFLATVSHEIRTPMNAVIGLLSLLKDTALTPQQMDYVDKISNSATSLLGLINDVLDFSKVEQGKMELEHIPFSLLDVFDNLVDIFSNAINEKFLELVIDLLPDVALERIGDPLRISQILINVIGNAIKFTEQGFIRLSISEKAGSRLVFKVEDSGIGLSPEKKEKIFGSFTQADDTTTRKFGGTGLGLSICKQLAELMEGSISAEGTPGLGSCFTVEVKIDSLKTDNSFFCDFKKISFLLISDNNQQIIAWKNFCTRYRFGFQSLRFSDLTKLDCAGVNSDFSHLFIDDCNGIQESSLFSQLSTACLEKTQVYFLSHNQLSQREKFKYQQGIQVLQKPVRYRTVLGLMGSEARDIQKEKWNDREQYKTREPMLGKSILLVEDNLINQQVAREILEKAGAVVTIVDDGKQAVNQAVKFDYDLILMDIQMPVMDGYKAAKTLRELGIETPIIAMTANVMKGDRERCMESGMNDYVGKPINRRIFLSVVESYLSPEGGGEPVFPAEAGLGSSAPISKPSEKNFDNTAMVHEKEPAFSMAKLSEDLGGVELALELVGIFVKVHSRDLDSFLQLVTEKAFVKAARLLHKLKGSVGEFGLTEFFSIIEVMEKSLALNQKPHIANIKQFQLLFSTYLREFVVFLAREEVIDTA